MSAIITSKFRIHNAMSFKEGFLEGCDGEGSTNIYLFISKFTPWDENDIGADTTTDDTLPPAPIDSVQNIDYELWHEMIAAKKVQPNDVTHVLPRFNWTSGTVYTQYDNKTGSLYLNTVNPFYVVTDEFHVYKCLYNKCDIVPNNPSVDKPNHNPNIFVKQYPDGYVWQYMYSISPIDSIKFVTTNHIPVKVFESDPGDGASFSAKAQWDTQQNALSKQGAIQIYNIDNSGTGYRNTSGTFSDNALDNADGTIKVYLDALTQFEAGADETYYDGMELFIDTGTTSSLDTRYYKFAIVDGSLDVVNKTVFVVANQVDAGDDVALFIANPNYTIMPKVTISGDGSGADVILKFDSGSIVEAISISDGSDYSNATVSVQSFPSVLVEAEISPIISPKGGHGSDPIEELGGFFVMINVRLEYDEYGTDQTLKYLTIDNDYRQIGLLREPLDASGEVATGSLYLQTVGLELQAQTSFKLDSIVEKLDNGGLVVASGRVVDVISADSDDADLEDDRFFVRLSDVNGTFTDQDEIHGVDINDEVVTAVIDGINSDSGVFGAELKKYSGDIMYIENRKPITRAFDQVESICIVVEF